MILPRSSSHIGTILARRLASTGPKNNLQLFKDINRLAREGKWDAINNSPAFCLCGTKRAEANAVYSRLIQPEDAFHSLGGQPYGPILFLASRVAGFVVALTVVIKAYELIVPEQYRLHYKYRPKHAAAEHH